MVAYHERLQHAVSLEQASLAKLAEALDFTPNGLKMALKGGKHGVSALTAKNNSIAAAFLKVDPDWLAIGIGEPRSERVWPFKRLSTAEFFSVSEEVRDAAEGMLQAAAKKHTDKPLGAPIAPAHLKQLEKLSTEAEQLHDSKAKQRRRIPRH